jgi:hypothetical protein
MNNKKNLAREDWKNGHEAHAPLNTTVTFCKIFHIVHAMPSTLSFLHHTDAHSLLHREYSSFSPGLGIFMNITLKERIV